MWDSIEEHWSHFVLNEFFFFLVVTAVGISASPVSDFQSYKTTVVLGTGEASVTDTIEIIDDDVSESTETFRLVLTEADGQIDAGNNEVIVTIIDDDCKSIWDILFCFHGRNGMSNSLSVVVPVILTVFWTTIKMITIETQWDIQRFCIPTMN